MSRAPRRRSRRALGPWMPSKPAYGWSRRTSGVRTVGRGGWPNILGARWSSTPRSWTATTRRTGAVGALKGFAHPISVARAVLERLPHELLAGDGAARFARDIGAQRSENLIGDSAAAWRRWVDANVSGEARRRWPEGGARRALPACRGPRAWVATPRCSSRSTRTVPSPPESAPRAGPGSTPGRLGDSPVVGAGSYADSRHGAAACTGAGEMTIRCTTARSVVLFMRMGIERRGSG